MAVPIVVTWTILTMKMTSPMVVVAHGGRERREMGDPKMRESNERKGWEVATCRYLVGEATNDFWLPLGHFRSTGIGSMCNAEGLVLLHRFMI